MVGLGGWGACELFVGLCVWLLGVLVFLLFLGVFSLCVSFWVVLWWGGMKGCRGFLLVFLEDVLVGIFLGGVLSVTEGCLC